MKEITVEKPVRDVNGLMRLLRAQDPPFEVVSVGADSARTYLYMDEGEQRDPAPIVQDWKDAPELQISVAGTPGHLGAMEVVANGKDVHILTIKKVTPTGEIVPGNEKLHITVRGAHKISNTRPRLVDGIVVVEVGPCDNPTEAIISVTDPAEKMSGASVMLRFTRKKPEPPAELPMLDALQAEATAAVEELDVVSVPERKGSIWSTLKRILRI